MFDGPVHKLGPHERAHYEAAKGRGCSGSVWYDKANGLYRWETLVNSDLDAAIINAAGVLAGGFDADADGEDVARDARRCGKTVAEIYALARPYANRGRRNGAGPPEAPPTTGARVRGNTPRRKRGLFYWE